jgi:hypothetical protein
MRDLPDRAGTQLSGDARTDQSNAEGRAFHGQKSD